MSMPMQVNFALLVPKWLNKRQKPAVLLKGVGKSSGMDGTYVGSPGNGVKGGKCSHSVAKCLFAERGLFTMREAYLLARQSR